MVWYLSWWRAIVVWKRQNLLWMQQFCAWNPSMYCDDIYSVIKIINATWTSGIVFMLSELTQSVQTKRELSTLAKYLKINDCDSSSVCGCRSCRSPVFCVKGVAAIRKPLHRFFGKKNCFFSMLHMPFGWWYSSHYARSRSSNTKNVM